MQYSPQQIKDKLLRALDEDNNVVDMGQVLEVISILETYNITREALEQTRIGKTVNDMRKKTKNEDLAKRAKRLVRKWQTLVQASGSGDGTTNGDGPLQHPSVSMLQSSPKSLPNSPVSIQSNISPSLPRSRPSTPLTPGGRPIVNRIRPQTPNSTGSRLQNNSSPKPRLTTPNVKTSQNSVSDRRGAKGRLVSPYTPAHVEDVRHVKKGERSLTNHSNGNKTSPTLGKAITEGRSDLKKRPWTDGDSSSNKRLSVRKATPISDTPTSSKVFDKSRKISPVNGVKHDSKSVPVSPGLHQVTISPSLTNSRENSRDSDSFSAKRNISFSSQNKTQDVDLANKLVKPPKARVKTTAQIIADLQAKSGTVNNDMVKRIACVEREADDLNASVVPASALPRARRKPNESLPPLAGGQGCGKLSPNKTELVEKFLLSSVAAPSPVEDYTAFREEGGGNSPSDTSPSANLTSSQPTAGPSETKPQTKLVDPISLLPPLNFHEIEWNEEEGYEVVEREMTDFDVEKISTERWTGVNGCLDGAGNWRDWTETFSSETYDGEILHILPYVNIDD